MKRTLLAAGAAALAMGLPATAALADGYNARPVYMHAKPKPRPAAKLVAKPAPKVHKQARHKPRVHYAHKPHGHAVAHVQYEKRETFERSVTHEVNGVRYGPYVTRSERYVAPHKGCLPDAPCGYGPVRHLYGSSQHDHAGAHGHEHAEHHGGYGHEHAEHHGSFSHEHSDHHGGYGHEHGEHHGAGGGYGATHHAAPIQPGFHHGPLTGGVGYGVDGGPVYGASTVVIRPGGYGHGFAARGSRYSSRSSASAYSSAQGHASSGYSTGGHGFGYGPTYGGQGGHGYLGFKPGAHGQGVGSTGYGGCCR